MHISTANISETVKARANIAIAKMSEVAHGLSIGIFSFGVGLFQRSSSAKAHLDCDYL